MKCQFLFFILIWLISVKGHINNLSSNAKLDPELLQLLKDLPVASNLSYYIDALERVVMFCLKHEHYIDINFAFGLFLIDVHLRPILEEKDDRLPEPLRKDIDQLLNNNYKILEYFHTMVSEDRDPKNTLIKQIASLFVESVWIRRLPKFHTRLFEYTQHVVKHRIEWRSYTEKLEDIEHWIPQPEQSDKCLASIGRNQVNPFQAFWQCFVEDPCRYIILNGSQFGYALSHRLLMLIKAKYGRGCSIFTPEKDKELANDLCSHAYSEAKSIANNGYVYTDLLYEFIALCSIDGHIQFLHNSWLTHLLRLQTPDGCFAESLDEEFTPNKQSLEAETRWIMSKFNHTILDGKCDAHVTSVSAGTLASAVRFILETYY